MDWIFIAQSLAKTVCLIFLIVLPMVAYTVYAERRVSAFIQDRLGPNRVGIPLTLFGFSKDIHFQGLLQPIADAVKLMLKEDFTPAHVHKFYYWLAPALAMVPSLLVLSVIPFGSSLWGVPMVVANVNVGVLFVFAIASLGVYGITLAGWSANSKYPFLGGIRSSSQMISYELALGLSAIPVFLIVGKLNLSEIVSYQIQNGWFIFPFTNGTFSLSKVILWVPMVISFIIFTIAMFAETNRLPFDLPEAETELVGGYHTEYSSMKFALFFLGEYAAMIAGSSVIVTLFLGGWHLPFLPTAVENPKSLGGILLGLVHIGVFFAKVAAFLIFFIWVRWTLPRFRYDQLMRLGWVWLFEIALVNIFLTAFVLVYFPG
jgi:NADH-quinone oxidoreductase subunit H